MAPTSLILGGDPERTPQVDPMRGGGWAALGHPRA